MQIRCKGLSFRYPRSESAVFEDLSLEIDSPGFYGLFGPSGVGKTTLARIIAGETDHQSGEVLAYDMDTILYCYSLEKLPGWCSVGEHLAAVTPPANRNRTQGLVASFGLEQCMDSRFARLSLGQQNRANVVRYLLQDFDLLIMDEGLSNVDEAAREQIIFKMKESYPGKCFLYISHNILEVSKFCREILVLRNLPKRPQVASVRGQDLGKGAVPSQTDLELTMLEIMHAS